MAADALLGFGGELAELSPALMGTLNETLPLHWSHNNPIDMIGDAGPDRYQKTLEAVAARKPPVMNNQKSKLKTTKHNMKLKKLTLLLAKRKIIIILAR